MDAKTRGMLLRWQSLNDDGSLKRLRTIVVALRCANLLAFLFAIAGIALEWPAIVVAAFSLAFGWLLAETNALRLRMDQWPVFKRYINWQLVTNDLKT